MRIRAVRPAHIELESRTDDRRQDNADDWPTRRGSASTGEKTAATRQKQWESDDAEQPNRAGK
ncbi:MAG TPA: hypothetical protein VNS10_05545 [Gemmatimonadaceae bacterium]|nr:hypothetical protein [Gemmatimonadaceae bacterium]